VRGLLGKGLDDYFIFPPTSGDLATLRRAANGDPLANGAKAATPAGLTGRDFARLTEAARSIAALENDLAEAVSARIDQPVHWADAEDVPPEVQPLLFAAAARPRVLVPDDPLAPPDEQTSAFLEALGQVLPPLLASARRTETLHRLAVTDYLTGTYNRRYFYHLTDQILLRAGRENFSATLLLYDIDDFKRYNDRYGYAAGDELLRETAQLMRRVTRRQDIVARIGGDEFAVLFWDPGEPRTPGSHPPETAYALAERFRQGVMRHEFPSLGGESTGVLTISGGLASFPGDGRTCRELLRQADKAIKAAKKSGKNAIKLLG